MHKNNEIAVFFCLMYHFPQRCACDSVINCYEIKIICQHLFPFYESLNYCVSFLAFLTAHNCRLECVARWECNLMKFKIKRGVCKFLKIIFSNYFLNFDESFLIKNFIIAVNFHPPHYFCRTQSMTRNLFRLLLMQC